MRVRVRPNFVAFCWLDFLHADDYYYYYYYYYHHYHYHYHYHYH